MSDIGAAAADLLLGGRCVGCRQPGLPLCPACWAELPVQAVPAQPDPRPPGLVAGWAAAVYAGTPRAMVLGLKERRLLGLARPLAELLALAVAGSGLAGPLVLVPVPSRAATVRGRGHDSTWSVTSGAAALLAGRDHDVSAARLLHLRPGVVDQAGLTAQERASNLDGSMSVPSSRLVRLARRTPSAQVVVCDDVLTTGSTVREAQRALEAVGLPVAGFAVVAATPRRP